MASTDLVTEGQVGSLVTTIAAEVSTKVASTTINAIVTLSQASYNALGTKDANTLYVIV